MSAEPTEQELLEQNELLHQVIDQADWVVMVAGNGESTLSMSYFPPGSKGVPVLLAKKTLLAHALEVTL